MLSGTVATQDVVMSPGGGILWCHPSSSDYVCLNDYIICDNPFCLQEMPEMNEVCEIIEYWTDIL